MDKIDLLEVPDVVWINDDVASLSTYLDGISINGTSLGKDLLSKALVSRALRSAEYLVSEGARISTGDLSAGSDLLETICDMDDVDLMALALRAGGRQQLHDYRNRPHCTARSAKMLSLLASQGYLALWDGPSHEKPQWEHTFIVRGHYHGAGCHDGTVTDSMLRILGQVNRGRVAPSDLVEEFWRNSVGNDEYCDARIILDQWRTSSQSLASEECAPEEAEGIRSLFADVDWISNLESAKAEQAKFYAHLPEAEAVINKYWGPWNASVDFVQTAPTVHQLSDYIASNRDNFLALECLWVEATFEEEQEPRLSIGDLLEAGFPPNFVRRGFRSILSTEIVDRDPARVHLLIDYGADLNFVRGVENNALHVLANSREIGILSKCFFDGVLNRLPETTCRATLFSEMAFAAPRTVVDYLNSYPTINLELRNHHGDTPLLNSAKRADLASTSALIGAGADANARDALGRNILHWIGKEWTPRHLTEFLEQVDVEIVEDASGSYPSDLALGENAAVLQAFERANRIRNELDRSTVGNCVDNRARADVL